MSDPATSTTEAATESAGRSVSVWRDAFVWRMAWRDSRTSRGRLFFFALAMLVGVAAIAGVTAFGENLKRAINEQSRSLLGADLVVTSRRPFNHTQLTIFESFHGEMSRGVNLSAMVFFPKAKEGRLIQLRGVDTNFPFYGELVTEPPTARETFRTGGVLVEESLLAQYHAKVGDPVQLGNWTGKVAGSLRKVPGETIAFGSIAPRVFISNEDLFRTGLVRPESLARFKVSFRFPEKFNLSELLEQAGPALAEQRLRFETVKDRQEELGRSMNNLYHFLNLSGFVALLLGGIAVGTALQLHLKQKLATIATLRCLGAGSQRTFRIYLVQALVLGLVCALGGAIIGVLVQKALPDVVHDFLPFAVTFQFSWSALVGAAAFGLLFCGLFALLPLLPVRRIPPLAALRRGWEDEPVKVETGQIITSGLIVLAVIAFAVKQSNKWQMGVGLVAGLSVAVALLVLVANTLRWLARKTSSSALPFVWRQGLASLHRPNNRTLVLLLSLGLGAFLLLTLQLTQHALLHGLIPNRGDSRPNAVLFDIQPDQLAGVRQILTDQKLTVRDEVPVVTMRLQSVKGVPVEELLKKVQIRSKAWPLRREYRSTYRNNLSDSEELVQGKWPPPAFKPGEPVPISAEEDIAKELKVAVGDELVFDVQGLPITTRIASIRKVDWKRLEPNFFMVFPPGVLEEAPRFFIATTYVATPLVSADMQRAVLQKFANVSIIDLTLVLQTLDDIFNKVSLVIRFMALFTVTAGLIVLAGTLLAARFQRVQESVLLRTLGATRRQVQQIQFVEYFCLGSLAALAACVLALAASAALAWWMFKMPLFINWTAVALTLLTLPALTVTIGWMTNRGVANHPPLAILRSET